MANKYANLIGTNLIKDEYTKINTGFDGVDADIKAVESAIENHETAADPHDQYALDTDLATLQTEVTSHKAENVSQVGGVHGLEVEEGTFTPIIYGTTNAGTPTYSIGVATFGSYKKIGKIVHFSLGIRLTSKGGLTGDLRIGGLPFILKKETPFTIGRVEKITSVDTGSQGITAYGVSNNTFITLYEILLNTAYNAVNDVQIADTFRISISGTYQIV